MDQNKTWHGGTPCPGHIVLDGDPAPAAERGTAAQSSAHVCCGPMDEWIKMPLGMEAVLGPGDFVLDGDPAPSPKKNAGTAHNFWEMFIVAKRLVGSRCHLVWR